MAIPFSILSYRPNTKEFGINFLRHCTACVEMSWWADIGPLEDLTRFGTIRGLVLPAAGRPRPTVLGYAMGRAAEGQGLGLRAGVDAKDQPNPSTTALVTVIRLPWLFAQFSASAYWALVTSYVSKWQEVR